MEASGNRIIRYGKQDAEFSIYDVADIHWGARGVAKEHLKRDIQRIRRNPYAIWFCGGDYMDLVMPGDKRFDPDAVDVDLRVNDLTRIAALLSNKLVDMFTPIKDKCAGWCIGNHEHKHMTRNSEMYIHEGICEQLNVPNMLFSGFAHLYFCYEPGFKGVEMTRSMTPPENYTVLLRCFIHHGFSAAATPGGKINALARLVHSVEADLVMMSHVHEQMAKAFVTILQDDNSQIGDRKKMGMITGTYLRGYSSGYVPYGEMRGYPPTTIGANRAIYWPDDRRIEVGIGADQVGVCR